MFGKKSVTYFIIFVVAVSVFAGVVIFVKKGLELPFPVPKTELSEKAKEQEKRDTQISELRALRQQAISQAPELTFREEEGKKEQEMGELKALREEQLSFEPEPVLIQEIESEKESQLEALKKLRDLLN